MLTAILRFIAEFRGPGLIVLAVRLCRVPRRCGARVPVLEGPSDAGGRGTAGGSTLEPRPAWFRTTAAVCAALKRVAFPHMIDSVGVSVPGRNGDGRGRAEHAGSPRLAKGPPAAPLPPAPDDSGIDYPGAEAIAGRAPRATRPSERFRNHSARPGRLAAPSQAAGHPAARRGRDRTRYAPGFKARRSPSCGERQLDRMQHRLSPVGPGQPGRGPCVGAASRPGLAEWFSESLGWPHSLGAHPCDRLGSRVINSGIIRRGWERGGRRALR